MLGGQAKKPATILVTHTLCCRTVPLPTFQRRVKLDLRIAEKISSGSVLLTSFFWVSQRTTTYTVSSRLQSVTWLWILLAIFSSEGDSSWSKPDSPLLHFLILTVFMLFQFSSLQRKGEWSKASEFCSEGWKCSCEH